ncbi:MAG: SLAC1 anion channel family protein [Chlamydiota bacterium]
MSATKPVSNRLSNFHITFFAIVLGLGGWGAASQKVAAFIPGMTNFASGVVYLSIAAFVSVALLYFSKTLLYPQKVVSEFYHPVKINFFPLVAKIFLLESVIFLSRSGQMSYYFWVVGTLLQFASSVIIISVWMRHTHFKIEHLTPGWFIPIVGSLMVPIAGVPHGFIEISWFFFAVGLIFWIALFAIVLYRVIFHEPIPSKLLPTLCILFAPPAIAFIAYSKLTGLTAMDSVARILYNFSLFLMILILAKGKMFARIPFFLSWWAYSFPLAAKTLASILAYHLSGLPFYRYLALGEFALLSAVIIILIIVTAKAVINREICVQD